LNKTLPEFKDDLIIMLDGVVYFEALAVTDLVVYDNPISIILLSYL